VSVDTAAPRSTATGVSRTELVLELVRAARPLQWTKNLLLFAGILFAVELDDPHRWLRAVTIFAAYCLASSAAYLVNDVHDREADRTHPAKRRRPVAAGTISPGLAIGSACGLAAAALALGVVDGLPSVLLLAGFLVLQIGYSLLLKHIVLLDVLVIAGLFVFRASAGAVAVDVRLSPWLVVCTGLLALFLALAKRRGERVLLQAPETPGRPVLTGYSLELVDQLVSIVAASTIASYALYTFTATSSDAMMLTIPFVVFGLFRYLYLVHRHDLGEEPEQVLIRDWPILLTVAGWVVAAATILILVGA
jgi:4-hydroxybenzoate polyprenyltransferase